MKIKSLSFLVGILSTTGIFAQINSDNVQSTKPAPQEILPTNNISKSVTIGNAVIDGNLLYCDSTETTLTVEGACSWTWYSDPAGTNPLGTDVPLTVSGITNDTSVYIEINSSSTTGVSTMPSQTGTYSSDVRGYWFQASTDFYITGATVPTDASSGTSNVAILRFNSGQPTEYPTLTNDFTVLALWQNATADTLLTCIHVSAGDYIGVLGNRADVNSYASGPATTTINGVNETIERLGMQNPLSTTLPQDVFSESGGSISRVQLLYGTTPITSGVIDTVNITVPHPTSHTTTAGICDGDSIYLEGAYQTTSGNYIDTLYTVSGCDSVLTTVLSVGNSYNYVNNIDICEGDSVLIGSTYYNTQGVVLETLQTTIGCDSTVTNIIQFVEPDVTVSQSTDGVTLTANATGASYQWVDCDNGNAPISGETNQSFTATSNGNYAVQVTENGCMDISSCISVNTVGLNQLTQFGLNIFPNPTKDVLNFTFDGSETLNFQLTDINGKVLWTKTSNNGSGTIDLSEYATGTYLLKVNDGTNKDVIRVVKN